VEEKRHADMSRTISLSDDYRSPLRATLVIQFVVVILSGLMLDRGIFARITLIAVVGFWAGVFVMMIRRPQAPTAIDLWIVRWGFLPLLLFLQVIARLIWWYSWDVF
jgi:hypothetical protein